MNRNIKSIAYALIARGIQIYFSEEKDSILASKLVCKKCGEPWYMNLTECFLCDAINPFLYKCGSCKNYISITNASKKCTFCGKENTLHLECPNPNCLSNKDNLIKKEINNLGGCFNKDSGFLTSLSYCLNCGNNSHEYKLVELFIYNYKDLNSIKNKIFSKNCLIIIRMKDKKYLLLKAKELNNKIDLKKVINLDNLAKKLFNY